jgi:hypothetical protein
MSVRKAYAHSAVTWVTLLLCLFAGKPWMNHTNRDPAILLDTPSSLKLRPYCIAIFAYIKPARKST